jgi:hypothetical protein
VPEKGEKKVTVIVSFRLHIFEHPTTVDLLIYSMSKSTVTPLSHAHALLDQNGQSALEDSKFVTLANRDSFSISV